MQSSDLPFRRIAVWWVYPQVEFNLRYWLNFRSNLRVPGHKFKIWKNRIGIDINGVTFGKFVTSLVQRLKTLSKKLICIQYLDVCFWTNDVTNFPKLTWCPSWFVLVVQILAKKSLNSRRKDNVVISNVVSPKAQIPSWSRWLSV